MVELRLTMGLLAVKPRRLVRPPPVGRLVEREVKLQKLLQTPVCELDLGFDGVLGECIDEVKQELRDRRITFVPEFYLGDDDFWTSDRAISINVPWYLANDDVWRLVNDHLMPYRRAEVMMYLRHEAGHAINYAFELWKRKDWTHTFGDFRRPYRDVYSPNPWSRDYVRYLHRWGMFHYAQKHPDEDWAETFAVWLDPASRWRFRYKDWQVTMAKLEYVDRILDVEGAARGPALNMRRGGREPYTRIKETVAEFFHVDEAVNTELAEYRKDLLGIFPRRSRRSGSRSGARGDAQSAGRFIHQHQDLLVERLSGWIDQSERRIIKSFLRQLQALCTSEDLVVPDNRRSEKLVDLTIVATWHVVDGVHELSTK